MSDESESELCIDTGDSSASSSPKKMMTSPKESMKEQDFNDYWKNGMKNDIDWKDQDSFEVLIADITSKRSKPAFARVVALGRIELGLHDDVSKIISSDMLKFILKCHQEQQFQTVELKIQQLIKAELDSFDAEKLESIEKFINLESLLVIYAILIKAKIDQSMSDVISMVLFMARASQEQPNGTLALCLLCLCLKAFLPKVFDPSNPFSNQLALTPYELIARRFPKEVSMLEQIHPEATKAKDDRYYNMEPRIRNMATQKNYMKFWEQGMYVKHDILNQSGKFNFGVGGLILLCTTLGQEWAQNNLWRVLEVNCAKSHERLVSDKEDLRLEQANELCHAIWAMQGIYSAYVSWNGKIAKQFVKITVKIIASMTQATGSTSKLNISNQAVHALLRNGQCNEDLAARAKLYKMVDDIENERKLPEYLLNLRKTL